MPSNPDTIGFVSVEKLVVAEVTRLFLASPRLMPEIDWNDRTPFTDGHIDLYSSIPHSTRSHVARAIVQVKGRSIKAAYKKVPKSRKFSVEHSVLDFFRKHNGGVYFLGQVDPNNVCTVFYIVLYPYRINHVLRSASAGTNTSSLTLKPLPNDPELLEQIVRFAYGAGRQGAKSNPPEFFLQHAESLQIATLGPLASRPTSMTIQSDDFAVFAVLPGGAEVPIDVELMYFPPGYGDGAINVPIRCGGVEYTEGVANWIDETHFTVRLSAALTIHFIERPKSVTFKIEGKRAGTQRTQIKALDFLIGAAQGLPMQIGDYEPARGQVKKQMVADLRTAHSQTARISELFDSFLLNDDMTEFPGFPVERVRHLLALHQAIVLKESVRATLNQGAVAGGVDIAIGDDHIRVVALPAKDEAGQEIDGSLTLLDPFDPDNRKKFRMQRIHTGGRLEVIESGTLYETLGPSEFAHLLNVRLPSILSSYKAIANEEDVSVLANSTVMKLILAADMDIPSARRESLLDTAVELCEWLLNWDGTTLAHQMNLWQIQFRRGELGAEESKSIRLARRDLRPDHPMADFLRAGFHVLLREDEELELALESFTDKQLETFRSWPLWNLISRSPAQGTQKGSSLPADSSRSDVEP